MKAIWPDTIVEETNLSVIISALRKALGESAEQKYIETIPKRGYRFVAPVSETGGEGAALIIHERTQARLVVEEERIEDQARWSLKKPTRNLPAWLKSMPRSVVFAMIAVIIVSVVAFTFYRHRANLRWARDSVPRVEALARDGKTFEAYDLAVQIQKHLPGEPTLTRLMPMIADDLSVSTDPAGARVYLKRFSPDEAGQFPPRQFVGITPINHRQIARGAYIIAIEKEGYAAVERTVSGALIRGLPAAITIPPPIRLEEKLMEVAKVPDRMVFVPGGEYRIVAWRRPTDARVRLDDYFIDKFEVTNREYKEFITAGGYLKKQFWKVPFIKDGQSLSWEEAMQELKDRTGLPGPRSWSSQNFPEGKQDHPVTDITWHEAAAYCAFRGKQLPTIFQWEKAARNGAAIPFGVIMPWGLLTGSVDGRANMKGRGTTPVDGFEFGMSPYGCYNMAGNVSEWCLNETSEGFITAGGSWAGPWYMFGYYGAFPGFYSSDQLGCRCALMPAASTGRQGAMFIKMEDEIPTYTPATEASFQSWLRYYRYDKTPLEPQIVEIEETSEWRREKITYNGAGGDRAIAYLYLPKNYPTPLQVIHFMPPGAVERTFESLPKAIERLLAPIIQSGRAVFGVVLKGYLEREWPATYAPPDPTGVEYREQVVNWITDIRRGLDYLETRGDLDASRLAYVGLSLDDFKLVVPAVETRYRSIVLMGAGVKRQHVRWKPEVNPINFVPHIRAPKLMIHGRYDEVIPLRTEGEPLYKLLREPKRLFLFDGGHKPPPEILVPTINDWLDETLGPVRRQ